MTLVDNLPPSLWSDCDAIYEQHQSLCLQLQDAHQLNVNLLLLAIWLDKQQHTLALPHWERLQQTMFTWEQKLLLPFRKLRRLGKNQLESSEYQQMLSVELMLERKSQAMISNTLQAMPLESNDTGQGANNVSDYLSIFNLKSAHYPSLQLKSE
ncbi:TIGR02444 family protein [Shewanella sp. 0m-4]